MAEKVRKQKVRPGSERAESRISNSATFKRGAFYMAERLYGSPSRPCQRAASRCSTRRRVFEVKDKATGDHVGLFYSDDFARAGKRRALG